MHMLEGGVRSVKFEKRTLPEAEQIVTIVTYCVVTLHIVVVCQFLVNTCSKRLSRFLKNFVFLRIATSAKPLGLILL